MRENLWKWQDMRRPWPWQRTHTVWGGQTHMYITNKCTHTHTQHLRLLASRSVLCPCVWFSETHLCQHDHRVCFCVCGLSGTHTELTLFSGFWGLTHLISTWNGIHNSFYLCNSRYFLVKQDVYTNRKWDFILSIGNYIYVIPEETEVFKWQKKNSKYQQSMGETLSSH